MDKNTNHPLQYFKDLEQLTKAGLIAYFHLFLWGVVCTSIGIENVFQFLLNAQTCQSLFLSLLSVNILYILIRVTNAIDWLGKIHIWIDNKFFKFLFKSNDIILRELIILLEPEERVLVDKLGRGTKSAIAQSIFSHLAENPSIFERLLRRNVFRSWIWYWITLYGTLAFSLLTLIAVSRIYFVPSVYTSTFFMSIGSVAFIHILMIYFMGNRLLSRTKSLMKEITDRHYTEILSLLRSYVTQPG
jgi:hypothetical protein